jgi:hypothetical protein
MKTISRTILLLGFFIAFLSTDSFSQSPLLDLQARETALNNDIATTQANIAVVQGQIAAVGTDIQAATDEGADDYVVALNGRQTDLNTSLATLQTTLSQLQAELTDIQAKITATQDELNQNDKNWWTANSPPEVQYAAPSPILSTPDPNDPNSLKVIFKSTGDAQQDAQIIHDWLLLHGLIDG